MKNFSTNSLAKILLVYDNTCADEVMNSNFGLTDVVSFKKNEFKDIYEFIKKNADNIDGFITVDRKDWEYDNTNIVLSEFPPYFIRRWFHINIKNTTFENTFYNIVDKIHGMIINNEFCPKYSFITPLYKTKKKYFIEAWESLKNQAINDFEWILIDDSPLGYECKFAEELAKNDIRVKYFKYNQKSNGNIGLSKYRGFCLSSGKYLIEFDHDDMLYPWMLSLLDDTINKAGDEFGFFCSDDTPIDENENMIDYFSSEFAYGFCQIYTIKNLNNDEIIKAHETPNPNPVTLRHIVGVPNHFRCWRRDIYFSCGGHNTRERIADDYELLVRTFFKTKFAIINYPCYIQRFDNNNSQNNNRNWDDIQYRVRMISNFYNKDISERWEELTGDKDETMENAYLSQKKYFHTGIKFKNISYQYYPTNFESLNKQYYISKKINEEPPYFI